MANLSDIPATLHKSKLFSGCDTAELKALVAKSTLKTYEPGEYIIKENDTGDEFYCVVSGRVEIQIADIHGGIEPVVLKTMSEGEALGEMILLEKNRRSASAVVKYPTQLLSWHYASCLDLFNSNPSLGYKVMRNLAAMVTDRLNDMNIMYRNK